jgi:uncharacterized membrane protein YhaH (DUF805 family)
VLQSTALFAQQDNSGAAAAAGIVGIIFFLLYMGVIVLMLAGMWKIFEKAGKPGWAAIVPIYNVVVLLEIVGKPVWWILLLLIPFVGIVFAILLAIELAKSFGKDAAYGLGLAFLPFIFYPILGFGSARYRGPATDY